jgi:hypothetical protein
MRVMRHQITVQASKASTVIPSAMRPEYIDAGCIREKKGQAAAELRISLLLKRLKDIRCAANRPNTANVGSKNPAAHAKRRRALRKSRGAKINGRNFTAIKEIE